MSTSSSAYAMIPIRFRPISAHTSSSWIFSILQFMDNVNKVVDSTPPCFSACSILPCADSSPCTFTLMWSSRYRFRSVNMILGDTFAHMSLYRSPLCHIELKRFLTYRNVRYTVLPQSLFADTTSCRMKLACRVPLSFLYANCSSVVAPACSSSLLSRLPSIFSNTLQSIVWTVIYISIVIFFLPDKSHGL